VNSAAKVLVMLFFSQYVRTAGRGGKSGHAPERIRDRHDEADDGASKSTMAPVWRVKKAAAS
jgi:hypothetical protein